MKTKVAWFSPRVPAHSDLADYTRRLEAELQHRFDARFFTEQAEGFCEPATGTIYPAALRGTPHALLLALSEVDVPIYHLGINPAFPSKTWLLSQFKPGLVILHDLKLHHFFEGIYGGQLEDKAQYLAHLQESYAEAGIEAGELYWQQELSIDFMAEHFPMTAWGVRNALGVVVHTPQALEAVRRETKAPVSSSVLPYDAHVCSGVQRGAATDCQQHLPSTYVERLGALCEGISEWRARHNRFTMASRVAELITPWSAASPMVTGEVQYAACIAGAF